MAGKASKLKYSMCFRSFLYSSIALLAIFASEFFFSISGLVGFEYGGAEKSPIYIRFIIMVFLLMLSVFVLSYVKKPGLAVAEIGFYLFFFLLILNHLVWVQMDAPNTKLLPENLILFLSMGVTGFMAARVIRSYGLWPEMVKIGEVLILVVALGLIVAIVQPFLMGFRVRGVGGASYQAASYYAAMCYGMIGFMTFRVPKGYRFKILHNRIMALVYMIIMVALFVAVLVNGGRGAFILLVLYTAMIFYWIASKGGWTWNGVFWFIAVLSAVPVVLVIALQKVFTDPILFAGWRRAVAFIGSADGGLIDLEAGSSGRDLVYLRTIDAIMQSPWFGHGSFGHWNKIGQPHNLFLDLAAQFGIPVAIIMIASVLVALLYKLKNFSNLCVDQLWVLVLFAYPMVNLTVSSGYFRSSLFWFCLAYLFLVNSKKDRKNQLLHSSIG